jgi:hypothetical protein
VRDAWLNLAVPLAEVSCTFFRGCVFRTLDSISISGSFLIRRVFTMRDAPYDISSIDQVGITTLGPPIGWIAVPLSRAYRVNLNSLVVQRYSPLWGS